MKGADDGDVPCGHDGAQTLNQCESSGAVQARCGLYIHIEEFEVFTFGFQIMPVLLSVPRRGTIEKDASVVR